MKSRSIILEPLTRRLGLGSGDPDTAFLGWPLGDLIGEEGHVVLVLKGICVGRWKGDGAFGWWELTTLGVYPLKRRKECVV